MQNSYMPRVWLIVCVILLVFLVAAILRREQMLLATGLRQPTTIADIAYDVRNRGADYRIFLKENGHFVPYLVLTANYSGSGDVLLLREYLLDQKVAFNYSPYGRNLWSGLDFGGYYPNSNIDNFLNIEFANTLCEAVIAAIVPSNIMVTDKSSMGVTGRTSTTITRYVFLLSLRELGVPDLSTTVPEGERLRFFRGVFHTDRVAHFSNSEAMHYWTRTPDNWTTYSAFIIGTNAVGSGMADSHIGVRPAFALCRYTAITTSTDIISGKTVFVLDTGNCH